MRKLGLFISGLLQYIKIRLRDRNQFRKNDLVEICKKRPILYAKNENELMFVMTSLRPIARRICSDNLCLDMSLVLISMSSIPAEIHFSVRKIKPNYVGHAWVETAGTLLSTDYGYDYESIWSWEKPIDAV